MKKHISKVKCSSKQGLDVGKYHRHITKRAGLLITASDPQLLTFAILYAGCWTYGFYISGFSLPKVSFFTLFRL